MNNSTESGRCRQNTARSAPRRTLQILKKVCGVFLCPDTERSKRPYQYFLCRASFLCENGQQYAGALRRRLHPPNLYPRHQAAAESGGGNDGKLHGAGHVGMKMQQKSQAGRRNFLSGTLCPSPDISACGSRCGSTKNRENKTSKKVRKAREIPLKSMDSSGILELLPRFELGTSSLPKE